MCSAKSDSQERYIPTPEEYGEVRRQYSERRKLWRASDETRKRISENHADVSGENNPFFGRKFEGEMKSLMINNQPNRKSVMCIETGEIYFSLREAERATGVLRSGITSAIARGGATGKGKNAIKLHWKYVDTVDLLKDKQEEE